MKGTHSLLTCVGLAKIIASIHGVAQSWTLLKRLSSSKTVPGFPDASVGKNPPAEAGDVGLIPGSGRFPGEGNGNPLQYSCLGNHMDRGAWQAHGVPESPTQLSD